MRHGLQSTTDCALCSQLQETSDHLLAACVYTREVWHRILQLVDMGHLYPDAGDTLVLWWLASRIQVVKPLRKGFDSLVLLVTWEVWKERNRRTFDNVERTPAQLVNTILAEAEEWMSAGFSCLAQLASDVFPH